MIENFTKFAKKMGDKVEENPAARFFRLISRRQEVVAVPQYPILLPQRHSPRNFSNISEDSCTVMTLTFLTAHRNVDCGVWSRQNLDLSRFRLWLRAKCSSGSGSAIPANDAWRLQSSDYSFSIHIIQCYEYAV